MIEFSFMWNCPAAFQVPTPFAHPPVIHDVPSTLHLTSDRYCQFFNGGHARRYIVVTHHCYLLSLVTDAIKHLFMCSLYSLYLLWWNVCLDFGPFLIGLLVFYHWVLNVLCVFLGQMLCQIFFDSVVNQSVPWVFILLTGCFRKLSFLTLITSK